MADTAEPSPKRTKRKPLKKVEQKSKLQFPKMKVERCVKCKQFLDSVLLYNGHPNNSNEEFIALTDEKLSLYTGKEETFEETSELPTHKVLHSHNNTFYLVSKNFFRSPISVFMTKKDIFALLIQDLWKVMFRCIFLDTSNISVMRILVLIMAFRSMIVGLSMNGKKYLFRKIRCQQIFFCFMPLEYLSVSK